MNTVRNILWILFGGLTIAAKYFLVSIVMMLTIVGIPFGLKTMKLGGRVLCPFGQEVYEGSWPSDCLGRIMNVYWWFAGGIYIAFTHLSLGILYCCTIVGIPFGRRHFKLMKLALLPFGNAIQSQ